MGMEEMVREAQNAALTDWEIIKSLLKVKAMILDP